MIKSIAYYLFGRALVYVLETRDRGDFAAWESEF